MTDKTYRIVRFVHNGPKQLIKMGLTLEEAKAHCNDPEFSGRTCSEIAARGQWFDGFEEER